MEYRSLGRTGVQVSPLCLGCMNFGRGTAAKEAYRIIDHALDAGLNFIDTANVYNAGRSEEIAGEALRRNGQRDNVILATKVHGKMRDDPNARGNHRRHIIEQCEASLKRLHTEWIDLYQIHRPQSNVPIDETLRALDDLVRSGKVRYVGTSTFAAWQIMESLWVSKELGLNRFVCEQPPYNLLDRRIERELIPMAVTYGLALIPWSPLAGGLLTGKYRRHAESPEDSRYREQREDLFNDSVFDVVEGVEKLAEEKDCSASQLTLSWCMNQPGITSAIIGPRTMDQLKDNLTATDVEITSSDRDRIDNLVSPGSVVSSYYEADFGPHSHRWL